MDWLSYWACGWGSWHAVRNAGRKPASLWDHYYRPRERAPRAIDAPLTDLIVDLSRERRSFGYRRLTALACRKLGVAINTKKVRRIMKFEGLDLTRSA